MNNEILSKPFSTLNYHILEQFSLYVHNKRTSIWHYADTEDRSSADRNILPYFWLLPMHNSGHTATSFISQAPGCKIPRRTKEIQRLICSNNREYTCLYAQMAANTSLQIYKHKQPGGTVHRDRVKTTCAPLQSLVLTVHFHGLDTLVKHQVYI